MADGMKSATRFVHKSFKDQQRQESIELFLGEFSVVADGDRKKNGEMMWQIVYNFAKLRVGVLYDPFFFKNRNNQINF